jgi:hypothetical protein
MYSFVMSFRCLSTLYLKAGHVKGSYFDIGMVREHYQVPISPSRTNILCTPSVIWLLHGQCWTLDREPFIYQLGSRIPWCLNTDLILSNRHQRLVQPFRSSATS